MRRNWRFGFWVFGAFGAAFCLWPFMPNFSRASLTLLNFFLATFSLPSVAVCAYYVLFISYLFVLILELVSQAGLLHATKKVKTCF